MLTLLMLSRNRPTICQNAVKSAQENAEGEIQVEILFDACEPFVIHNALLNLEGVKAYESLMRHYYVRGANAIYASTKAETFVFTNDDSMFAPGWDRVALEALEKFGGLVELGGEAMKCAHFITTRKFIDEVNDGWLAYPGYTFYYSDKELMFRAMDKEGYKWLDPGVITHQGIKDSVRSDVEAWLGQDKFFWLLRAKEYGWPEWTKEEAKAVEPIWKGTLD